MWRRFVCPTPNTVFKIEASQTLRARMSGVSKHHHTEGRRTSKQSSAASTHYGLRSLNSV
jgi:hypothetical protein